MEMQILEKTKKKLKLKLIKEDHTLCNAIRRELWEDKNVDFAGYRIEHPLIKESTILLETTKQDPRKALLKAADSLKNKLKELEVKVKSSIK